MRCWAATQVAGAAAADAAPGSVLAISAAGIDVQTGDGVLRLNEIQMPGRRRIAAAQFANGYPLAGKAFGR
jgi:methionyl-tRNA formyltransferase